MRSTANSLYVFGLYLMFIPGFGLMCCPEALLDFFQLESGDQLWLARMVGLLAFCLGVFEWNIAKHAVTPLYKVTVYLRYGAALFMVGLWIIGEAGVMILGFSVFDALGATWTLSTLSNASKTQ